VALATRLSVTLNRAAQTLEALPGGRWRIHHAGGSSECDTLVLALPSQAAAPLLEGHAPESAALLRAIPRLDLRVWHSRHAMVEGWERGLGLLVHPPEGRGLLGAVSFAADDPRGVPGLLQLRSYVGGAFPVDPALGGWPGVFAELRRWLPELSEALQVREEAALGAFPLLEPGHGARIASLLGSLPPGLHWIGAERFGPGMGDLAEGAQAWGRIFSPSGR
jgi:oxygen-dependent protoporphyrinogen oxidase